MANLRRGYSSPSPHVERMKENRPHPYARSPSPGTYRDNNDFFKIPGIPVRFQNKSRFQSPDHRRDRSPSFDGHIGQPGNSGAFQHRQSRFAEYQHSPNAGYNQNKAPNGRMYQNNSPHRQHSPFGSSPNAEYCQNISPNGRFYCNTSPQSHSSPNAHYRQVNNSPYGHSSNARLNQRSDAVPPYQGSSSTPRTHAPNGSKPHRNRNGQSRNTGLRQSMGRGHNQKSARKDVTENNGEDEEYDISLYYSDDMVEDPWADLKSSKGKSSELNDPWG